MRDVPGAAQVGRTTAAHFSRLLARARLPQGLAVARWLWDLPATDEAGRYAGCSLDRSQRRGQGHGSAGEQDFRYRRKVTYPSGFELDLVPDGAGKLASR
ncbi:MAG: hypothetical protein IT458_13740 [Planctomycetes bacterium]|nr:hypothetical protein [Planctomycetota bacterium]